MLGRDTKWRQGSLLDDKHIFALGLIESLDSAKCAVVISHDCDLPNESEKFVEVIVGCKLPKSDPNFISAKHPRRLHLKFISEADEPFYVELCHADRLLVIKTKFITLPISESAFTLPIDEKRALKQWLAARYGRPAFPNAFENRLRKTSGKKTVEQRIAKILEPEARYLIGLFMDLGEDRDVELPDGDAYFLSISVVYDATEGGQAARHAAEAVAESLCSLFKDAYGASEIILEACNAVADTMMSLADLRKVDQWRVEYISLREDPPSDFLAIGQMPY